MDYKLVVFGFNRDKFEEIQKQPIKDTDSLFPVEFEAIESGILFYNDGTNEKFEVTDYSQFVAFYLNIKPNKQNRVMVFTDEELYSDLNLIADSEINFSEEVRQSILQKKTLAPETREALVAKINGTDIEEELVEEPIDESIEEEETIVAPVVTPIVDEDLEEPTKDDNFAKKAAITGAILGAGAIGLGAGLAFANKNKTVEEVPSQEPAIEVEQPEEVKETLPEVPSMVGQDYLYYADAAFDNGQKNLMVNGVYAWPQSVNAQESWERVMLDSKKAEELGYNDPECIFGFTADDAYSLALRFGRYTKDEYVTLTGGKSLDVVSIMDDANSLSNGALSKITAYYVSSSECHLEIDKLINFNESEVAQISELETLFREYHELENAKKDKEAFAKMQEIKKVLEDYAYKVDEEQSQAKSYILRTFAPAASIISQVHQYKDTISIELYDVVAKQQVTKNVKTDLFDELMMRTLVTGFDNTFDSGQYLENLGLSSKKYNLLNHDVEKSIADKSCGAQSERLQEADEYILKLKMEDTYAESAYAGANGLAETDMDNLSNVITSYDKLVHGTYDPEFLIEMINNQFVQDNIYPKNVNYFATSYIAEKQIELKNNNGITRGKKGNKFVTEEKKQAPVTEEQLSAPGSVVINHEGKQVDVKEAMKEAREENVKKTGIPDASTPEASIKADEIAQTSQEYKQKEQQAQATYDQVKENILHGDGSMADANSTDSAIKLATEHALNEKEIDEEIAEHPTVGGEKHIFAEFEGAEISEVPLPAIPSIDNKNDETIKIEEPQQPKVEDDGSHSITEEQNKPSTPKEDNNQPKKEQEYTNEDPTKDNPFFKPVVPEGVGLYTDADVEEILSEISEEDLVKLLGEEEVQQNFEGFSK